MDAAVCRGNAGLEVQKLQDLVRRLELQNEQLRSRTCTPRRSTCNTDDVNGAEASVLDEVELLDLDSLSGSDQSEDTWLYVAPTRTRVTQTDPVSPLRWCRQIQDGSKSDLEARRSLAQRLEQACRWHHRSPSSSSTSSTDPTTPVTSSPITSTSKPCSGPRQSGRQAGRPAQPPLPSPLHPVLQRSLSPIRKDISSMLAGRTPTFIPHLASRSCSRRRPGLGSLCSEDSDLGSSALDDDDTGSAMSYKLKDLTDVQVMARLQEESLRRRWLSTSDPLSAACLLRDEEDYGLARPSPLARLPHSLTVCSTRGWPRSSSPPSTPSTPPLHSAGFSFLAPPPPCLCGGRSRPGPGRVSDKLQTSLPNLLRAPSVPSVPRAASPALLRNSHSFDSCLMTPPQPLSRVHSLDSFRPPMTSHHSTSPGLRATSRAGASPLHRSDGGGGRTSHHSQSRRASPGPSLLRSTRAGYRSSTQPLAHSFLTPPKILSSVGALGACC